MNIFVMILNMNNFDIDKFLPKFHTKEEIYDELYDLCMKQISLDIEEMSLNQMLIDNKISENDYLVWKSKIEKKRKEFRD